MKQKKSKKSFFVMINTAMIGIVSIAILAVSFLFFYYLYHQAGGQVLHTLSKDLTQINQQLTKDVETVFDVTNRLACDVELGNAVEKFYVEDLAKNVEGKKMMDYILQNTIAMNQSIFSVQIAKEDEIIRYNKYGRNGQGDIGLIKRQDWYQKLLDDKVSWIFEPDNLETRTEGERYFLCATKFKTKFYEKREEENRVVIVSFQLKELENLMQNTAALKNMNVFLYDGGRTDVIYNVGVSENFEKMMQAWDRSDLKKLESGKNKFMVLKEDNSVSGWSIVGCVERSVYKDMIYPVQTWLLLVVVFILAGTILVSIMILQNVSKPLKNVVQGMEDLGKQDFYSLSETGRYVEFEQLVDTFNRMSERIKELIRNIEQKEREKRIEEFKVLEYQINPHFIYNTLDGIRWMALMNNSTPVAGILGSFSNFLRLSLSKGKELVTVETEIEMTMEYIKIMIFRNNMEVKSEYSIEGDVRQMYTLKMVLQPIVENCFIHAFDRTVKEPYIHIRCYRREGALFMEVEDNGAGMKKQEKTKKTGILTGLGIHNIEERIKIWHGRSYGIRIEEAQGQGTKVTVIQPLLPDTEEDGYDTGNTD